MASGIQTALRLEGKPVSKLGRVRPRSRRHPPASIGTTASPSEVVIAYSCSTSGSAEWNSGRT